VPAWSNAERRTKASREPKRVGRRAKRGYKSMHERPKEEARAPAKVPRPPRWRRACTCQKSCRVGMTVPAGVAFRESNVAVPRAPEDHPSKQMHTTGAAETGRFQGVADSQSAWAERTSSAHAATREPRGHVKSVEPKGGGERNRGGRGRWARPRKDQHRRVKIAVARQTNARLA